MSFTGQITKQPREQFTVAVNFAGVLATEEVIEAAVLTIEDLTNRDLDLSGDLFAGSHAVEGSVVTTPLLVGGEDRHHYVIEILVTTSLGNKFEADLELIVQEI